MTDEPIAQMLARAIQLVREKRREEGRALLLQVIERDEQNEQAWLWLSGVVDDPRDMQVALANALTINPGNEQARRGLELLRQRHGDLLAAEAEPGPAAAPAAASAVVGEAEEGVVAFQCYACRAEVYSVADACWQCHAWIHCCNNCVQGRDMACREQHGYRGPAAGALLNSCPEWRPRL